MGLITTATRKVVDHRWQPNAKQLEVLQEIAMLPEDEYLLLGYGGAAGGAKTNLIANLAWAILLSCPGSRLLVGRNELVHLRTTTLEEFDKWQPAGAQVKRVSSPVLRRDVRLPGWPPGVWSTVFFQAVKDAKGHIGSEEYSWVLLDEAHDIADQDIRYLFTRLRHRPEKKYGMIVCFNPFPCAAVDWFIEGQIQEFIDEMTELMGLSEAVVHSRFIQSFIRDNPHLPRNYEAMQFATLDPYLRAVMLEGRAEAVPNAVYEILYDPEVQKLFKVTDREEVRWAHHLLGMTGWDWGTSAAHKAAGCLLSLDNHGVIWVLDAWESALGSSHELAQIAEGWKAEWGYDPDKANRHDKMRFKIGARYDASQGSLDDDLSEIFPDTEKGTRDVEGRIRAGRGLMWSRNIRFNWRSPGVQKLWRYLQLYHRDDNSEIVEEKDDMVDAFHYAMYELVHRNTDPGPQQGARTFKYKAKPQLGRAA